MPPSPLADLHRALAARFADAPDVEALRELPGVAELARMTGRGSCRAFEPRDVPLAVLRPLSAVALSAPSKSDLQQRDVVIVRDPEVRRALDALTGEAWASEAPAFVVICASNRRQRLVHEWRGHPFANDHLDAFFNAAVDAGIALAAFVTAAEAVGLACCPVSAVRNRAQEVSDLL